MPSQAYSNFLDAIDEVNRFYNSHKRISSTKPGPGRRALGHITGGSVVFLCASWEQYIKNVMIKSIDVLQTAGRAESPTKLPKSAQDSINAILKKNREFKPLDLRGDNWCEFYDAGAKKTIKDFHSPGANSVSDLFKSCIGIDRNELFDSWSVAPKRIDQIVNVRNRIAHVGVKKSGYPQLKAVLSYKVEIMITVMDTENFLREKLKSFSPKGKAPWRRTKKLTKRERNLLDYKG